MQLHEYSFRMAQPVWETGTAHTMNRTVSFCTDIPLSDLPAGQQIRLAAAASCSFVLLVTSYSRTRYSTASRTVPPAVRTAFSAWTSTT